jgi:hypothetical protein
MLFKKFLLFIVIVFSPFTFSGIDVLDVVFDIDWTIVYPLESTNNIDQTRLILAEGKPYRITDWTEEVIEQLVHKKDIRISFYSGGDAKRNNVILQQIKLKNGKSLFDIAYKILHKEDLSAIAQDSSLPFSKRYKKDLRLIDPDLSKIVLIDDVQNFTLPHQYRHQLWLNKTYNFYEEAQHLPQKLQSFDPPNLTLWKLERNKLVSAYQVILDLLRNIDSPDFLNFIPSKLPTPKPCSLLL